jgi:hypothetical protein
MSPAPTPHNRVARLLQQALPLVSPDHPAFAFIEEASRTASGLDPYLEAQSSPSIVPQSHTVPEKELREVRKALLAATDAEDWEARYEEGKTQWALNSGMVSGIRASEEQR